MANQDIAELRRQYNDRIAKNRQEAIALLIKKFPNLEIDEKCLIIDSMSDGMYHLSNREYIRINLMNDSAIKCETELGLTTSWSKEKGHDYQLIETSSFIVYVEWSVNFASTKYFNKSSGKAKKGRRLIRDIKTSSKGSYIVINGKRYYKDNEATV